MNARRDLLGDTADPDAGHGSEHRCGRLSAGPSRRSGVLQRHAAEFSRQMGQRHLPGADDVRRADFGDGGRLEVRSRGRTRDAETGPGFAVCPWPPHTDDADGKPNCRTSSAKSTGCSRPQRSKVAADDENALEVTTLNVAAHRLENLIHDRRASIAARSGGAPPEEVRAASTLPAVRSTRTLDLVKDAIPLRSFIVHRIVMEEGCCVAERCCWRWRS